MSNAFTRAGGAAFLILAVASAAPVLAQLIDFETLPGGDPTADEQEISDQYAAYGVTFTLLDRDTGQPIGFPRIAKAGPPRTAFNGCYDVDTPLPHLDLGVSFLTDGTALGVEGDLLIEYATPVAQASGVILDIDCRVEGGPPCEQWTVTAYDALGAVVDVVVLDGPPGDPNPECIYPEVGPGDADAFGWLVSALDAEIASIVLRYTGVATDVGLAFDAFSVASEPGPPTVAVASPADTVCSGERIVLQAVVSGGVPPYTFQWQRETQPEVWVDLGTDAEQEVQPVVTTRYRVSVTDAALETAASDPYALAALADDPLCAAELIVSSYSNDRVLRYSFRSHQARVFVPDGSGGLNGPARLTCGGDGELYVASQINDRVLRYGGATGDFIDTFVAAGSGGLSVPIGLDFGPDGNLYIASWSTNSVLRYSGADGSFIDAFVPAGSGLSTPAGLVFGPGDDLFVCSLGGDKVLRFDGATGAPLGDFVSAGSGGLDAPRGIAFGPDGNCYLCEEFNDAVRRYDGTNGAFIDVFVLSGSGGLDRPTDLVFGLDGILYVCSYSTSLILGYSGATGAFLGALPGDFLSGPAGIAVGCQPIFSAAPDAPAAALALRVEPAVPNPFNPRTTASFTLPRAGRARVTIVDVAGRLLATLCDADLPAGRQAIAWDGRDDAGRSVPSGAYFLHVQSGALRGSAKLVLVR